MLPLLIRARARILDTARKVEAGLLEALRPSFITSELAQSIFSFFGTVRFAQSIFSFFGTVRRIFYKSQPGTSCAVLHAGASHKL